MRKLHLIIVALLLFFTACSSTPEPKNPHERPLWVFQPNVNGKTGAVGVAGRTYDQLVSSQRKLAIERALDELSLQMKVKVELSMHKEEVVTNSKAHLSTHDKSHYTANNTLTAHIQEVWMDRESNQLYVWMVLDR